MTTLNVADVLSRANGTMYQALTCAISAIYLLDDAGCTVRDIDIRAGKPVLQVDRPPEFVRGAPTMTMRVNDHIERRMAAPWHGGQIEWTEREYSLTGGLELVS